MQKRVIYSNLLPLFSQRQLILVFHPDTRRFDKQRKILLFIFMKVQHL